MAVKWDVSKLEEAVNKAECYADVCRLVGLEVKGRNYDTIKRHIQVLNLDTSHFKSGKELMKNRSFSKSYIHSDNEFFVIGHRKRSQVKKRLLNYKKYECEICGLSDNWHGQSLVLHLDHINGNSIDNRIENLRFLCPNCHSQTTTYAGKSSKQKPSEVDPNWRNKERPSKRKVNWPTKEELKVLIDSEPMVKIGKKFGVSDNAVRKWAKKYELL